MYGGRRLSRIPLKKHKSGMAEVLNKPSFSTKSKSCFPLSYHGDGTYFSEFSNLFAGLVIFTGVSYSKGTRNMVMIRHFNKGLFSSLTHARLAGFQHNFPLPIA